MAAAPSSLSSSMAVAVMVVCMLAFLYYQKFSAWRRLRIWSSIHDFGMYTCCKSRGHHCCLRRRPLSTAQTFGCMAAVEAAVQIAAGDFGGVAEVVAEVLAVDSTYLDLESLNTQKS